MVSPQSLWSCGLAALRCLDNGLSYGRTLCPCRRGPKRGRHFVQTSDPDYIKLYKYSRAHAFLHTNLYSTPSPIVCIHKYQKRLRYVGENSISDLAVWVSTLLKKKLIPQHTSWYSHAYGCLNNRSGVFQPTPSQYTLLLVDRGINISYMHRKLMIRT